ncbi:MAG: DUF3990 domain-containing protein [Bacteroidetes bacterium]|nr:DUF3990 domain-containing protein [Bacteroidota bacterium]MCL1968907.1 DUF3990 domain-containing protein [Bacteroidota bacterium]MCL1969022.1 DUF3990 domain-containing protein [Bacteroidota bacterium]
MRVFHGSYTKIDNIDLSKCEIGKDFGQGFYVTKIKEQAQFWAERRGLSDKTKGIVTEFEFNENAFLYFNLKTLRFVEYDENWLDFVAKNRDTSLPQPTHDYDIVEGPVADDKIATRITTYLKGKISKQQFLEELKFMRETHQICFCTRRSLQMLNNIENSEDIGYELSKIGESLIERFVLDFNVFEEKATDIFYSSKTFGKLADESTDFYKKTWQEVYEMLKLELRNM